MPDIRAIRRQIRGVQNIAKITRAMEMVAASKMKKAQERGLAGRSYAEHIRQVIADLAAQPDAGATLHPCLACRPVNNITIIHITPDRGLCGGLVGNLNRSTASFLLEQEAKVKLICVGRKGLVTEFVTALIEGGRLTPGDYVFACGPVAMFKALQKILGPAGIECEAATEEYMGCGFGVCFGCNLKQRQPDGSVEYKLCCVDGCIFPLDTLVYEDEA